MLSKFISPLIQTFSSHLIFTILFSSLILLTLTLYITSVPRRFPIDLPTLLESPAAQRKRWKWKSHEMLLEGYRKYPGKIFQVWTSEGPEIIIPPEFLDELKALPDTFLSSIAGLAEMFQSRYTTIPIEDGHFGTQFAKTMLTKNLGKVLSGMIEELNFVLPQHFKSYPEWTAIIPHPLFTSIITSLTARVFVGPKLCRLSSWLQTTEAYSKDVFIASSILKIFPVFSRHLVKNFIPQIWSIRKHNQRAAQIVEAALKDKIPPPNSKHGNTGLDEKNCEDQHGEAKDAAHGIWELLPDDLKRDYHFQGRGQLGLAAAGIHSTSSLVTNCVYSLAHFPEYATILRGEIEEVKIDIGGGQWTVEALGRLRMLDSFMKEVMRLYSGGITSFRRKILLPIPLSNGITLPAGSYISAPLHAISHSPSIYTSPEDFSAFRFLNQQLRHSSSASQTSAKQPPAQLTSTTSTAPFFGLGRHACPGRFFAVLEAKLVLLEMVGRYEFSLEDEEGSYGDGVKGKRPGDVVFNSLRIVKPGGAVLIRDLKG